MRAPAEYLGVLMSHAEASYYRQRALIERQRAAESTNPHAVEIHRKLADLYEQLVAHEESPPPEQHAAAERRHAQA